ncbi:hypothetical protein Halru_2047 [Halovivax ruber XH-70]|uniref:Uncharacterized protein n=1 Tax=Halovivax ruber (strain DSM 18193 / JCM 13892 / XH-70) TaxID=797302 RepID=L0IEI8_HALRX|nr:hypothetical protein [Halovivax ruber]AGB16641.1 hypothetical protein Halru_2047 [Halovivax ruber XH-70]
MSSEWHDPEPREFVYLDEESINGHLSSIGVGVATDAQRESESESERQGRLRSILPLFAGAVDAEVSQRELDSQNFQQQIKLTAPYRFDRLQKEFQSEGIEIKDPSDEGVSFGDVVKIEGEMEAMSLFRIELHDEAIASWGEAFSEAAETVENSPDVDDELIEELGLMGEKAKGNKATASMAKRLHSDRVPLRLDDDGQSYAVPLRRDSKRTPLAHAFSSPRPYTVFGRIEGRIGTNDSWVPGDMIRTLKALSEDAGTPFNEAIREIAAGRDIMMEDRHMGVEGPGKVVHPIAIWW